MADKIFSYNKESIIVDVPILELYIPFSYSTSGLYGLVGEGVEVFAIANFRTFTKEADLAKRDDKDTHPLCIGAYIRSLPREIEIEEVSDYGKSKKSKKIILRYYKGDTFVVNQYIIKSVDNIMAFMGLFESGKLNGIPYDVVPDVIELAQQVGNVNLRLPRSDIETMVAERYRDPKDPSKKARFMNGYPREVTSVNPREDLNMSTTFSTFAFEDINTSIIVADNRKAAGVVEHEVYIEKLIKGEKIPHE